MNLAFDEMELPISQLPSTESLNKMVDESRLSELNGDMMYNNELSLTPFDNFEQEAYYITNNNINISNLSNITYDNKSILNAYNITDTPFIHYPASDQLSIPCDIDIDLQTVSLPFDADYYSISQLLLRLADVEEEILLNQKGYQQQESIPICDTLQGQLLKCKRINGTKPGFVAIKKTDKHLLKEKISKQDGFSFCCEENVIREAKILKYLTVDNKTTEYITKYIDFFESESDYYLVTEYVDGEVNLKQFVKTAHQYMANNKLDLKQYQKIIKYIFWQISAVLHWLHNDMHCCHLDLNLKNVMLKNGNFIENENGSITINGAISVKLCGFGCSEVFEPRCNRFECVKTGSVLGSIQYQSPKMVENEVYDARAADIWSLGIMLFECIMGKPLYTKINTKEGSGYWAAINNKINEYILVNNLKDFVNSKFLILLNGLINHNEKKRINTFKILQSRWFKSYFKRYKEKIEQKSIAQKKKFENKKYVKSIDVEFYSYRNCK